MIAVILAAGRGSRVSKLAKQKPKSLLNIYQRNTILDYQIKILKNLGVKKIILIVGYKSKIIKKKYKNKSILFIDNKKWKTTNVLQSFALSTKYLTDDFLFLHADSLAEQSIYKKIISYNSSTLPVDVKKCGNEEMKLYKINKKIYLSKDNLKYNYYGEFMGIAYFKKEVINKLKLIINKLKKNKNFNKFFAETAFNDLSNSFKIRIYKNTKFKFEEIDTPKDYVIAKKKFKSYMKSFFK